MLADPSSNVLFSPWPFFDEEQVQAAADVLRSGKVNYWTGTVTREFEREFAAATDSKYAIALANGTVAIEAAFEALGIGPGDEVIVTPRTFMASGSSVVRVGAKPIFADLDRRTGNLDPHSVEQAITTKTKAVLAVHLGGWPCDIDALGDLCRANNLYLLEDCAQAHGAKWKGQSVGSFGTISAWSFCQDKILTTGGEGGMVTTNSEELWKKMWWIKDHGKDFDAVYNREHAPGFRWLHEHFGTNWRLTEPQSAIGRIQLARLPDWTAARTQNAESLLRAWGNQSLLRIEWPDAHETHAYYKLYVYVRPEALKEGWNRDRIMVEIANRGVPAFSGSCSEIYLEKAFKDAGLGPVDRLPVAKELGETSLMFLVHPTLSTDAIDRTAEVAKAVFAEALR